MDFFSLRNIWFRVLIYAITYIAISFYTRMYIRPDLLNESSNPYFFEVIINLILVLVILFPFFRYIKNQEKKLKKSEKNYRKLLELSPETIALIKDGKITYINQAGLTLLDVDTFKKIENQPVLNFMLEEDKVKAENRLTQLHNGEEIELEERSITTYTGEKKIIESIGTLVELNDEEVLLFFARDVTEKKKHEKEIEKLAYYDELTGLGNRRLFKEKLEAARWEADKKNHSVGLMIIDVDDFKQTNDTFGHDIGDKLLQAIAERLKSSVRKADIVVRYGGDEFSIILPNATREQLGKIGDRIQTSMENAININNIKISVNLTIGISLYPDDTKNEEELITFADDAMYKGKKNKNKSYIFYKS